jgi:transposase InsO family protein
MSQARLIITAVTLEGRTRSEVARDYGVSRYWVQTLVKRFLAEGEAAFEPRSRRPHTSPQAVTPAVEEDIVRLRKELSKQGLDAGADTIHTHLARRTPRSKTSTPPVPAVSTIWRVLTRRGFVTAQPQKRPKSSWHRFTAAQPNERWQADITHWQLADGTEAEILNIEDDHSRLDVASQAATSFTAATVVAAFRKAFRRHGIPARVLTDNGAVFTGKPRRGGQVALEHELITLRVRLDHSRPYPPQTCCKL